MKTIGESAVTVPKTRKEYNDADRKAIEKNFRAKKILVCGIGPDEYNKIFACQSAKQIWEALQTTHEGTTQVKQSKIDMLTTEYELFRMKDDESIQDMHTCFTSIINELHSLGETILRNKLIRKILSVLPSSWKSKVNAITRRKKDHERRDPKREKNLVLKIDNNESSCEDADMAYLTKRFQKMVRRNGGIPKRGSSSKPRGYGLCHKCGKPGHFIKDCPLLKQDQYKHNTDKAVKRNPVPNKRFKRKDTTDNVMKQALAAWGDSSSESGEDDEQGDSSMMAVESAAADYDSIFALIAKSDDDELNFLDGKEVASEAHIELEIELKSVKSSLCVELERNRQLQEDLGRVKNDLKKSLKWTWSSETIAAMYTSNGSSERKQPKWYMNSGCSKHMMGNIDNFLSLKALQGGSVSFGNVTNLMTDEVVLMEKRYKNIYVADFESLQNGDLTCLSAVDDDVELWHRRLGHASFTLLNNLVRKDLVRGLPKSSFKDHKDETFPVFAAFVKKIQVKMSYNVVCIRSDHDAEFDNANFDEFCAENDISHNFSALRTP
ncbi:uncharacterized protein LOC142167053 [Nicotiana tabacum]|uniref:Uncharacterized protein LOC142167053 n=1 Tax=Nicotiana tabacum TaxID=4097 RepID=A0AC58SEA0_TOBAC